ncbi:MAG: MEMAR_RS02690 family S-layer glycoprotein, partial [Methanoregula sp.]
MTKRLSIALVAVALFVLLVVMPVSAVTTTNPNGTQIDRGATVFIGEEHLNLTHALNAANVTAIGNRGSQNDNVPALLQIGWWASAAQLSTSSPTKTINLEGGRYYDFTVAPADFVGYTGNWYLLNTDGSYLNSNAVMNVQDPTLSVAVWDFQQSKDITGMSITQGEHLGIQVNTNMYAATYSNRNNTKFSLATSLLTHNYNTLPNGETSTWNTNFTGAANGSYVFKTDSPAGVYSSPVSSEIWLVRNYTGYNVIDTTFGIPLGTYYTAYWNNSSASDAFPYTGKNFTVDKTGLSAGSAADVWANKTTYTYANSIAYLIPNETTDGFINLYVKDESGAKYDKLYVGTLSSYSATSITKRYVITQPWTFGSATSYWVTDALDYNNQYAYPVGTYSVWAESALNNMKENYKNAGADYTGKTVSATGTVNLISDTVKIEANKDSVVRSKSFSVTVTGKPSTTYYVWVKGTSAMDSSYDNQAPMTALNQEKVYNDDAIKAGASPATHPIGDYQYDNGAYATIFSDVAQGTFAQGNRYNSTRYYALINTSTSGTRTIEWVTNNWTKAQKYTIRVEQNFPVNSVTGFGAGYQATGATVKSDEVDINVEKGAVTIVAAGDQSYYLGEEIKFSGTNTETYKTYLFIVGPNLKTDGSQINKDDPRNFAVETNNESTFKVIDVNGDNTWSWKWGTANYALDAGTYTIYAVSQPYDKESLENAAYGTVSIIIKKPFVSATASQSTVAKGDRVYITGTAEGDPNSIQIWIMGKNYAKKDSASVNSDASFKYEIKQETTKTLSSGQYFVVVQHPMQNTQFDV